MGHKNGLDGVYYNPTIEKRFEEFSKSINELTISNEEREKAENVRLRKENAEFGKGVTKLERKVSRADAKVNRLLKVMSEFDPKYDEILKTKKSLE